MSKESSGGQDLNIAGLSEIARYQNMSDGSETTEKPLSTTPPSRLSRRAFLKFLGVAAAGYAISSSDVEASTVEAPNTEAKISKLTWHRLPEPLQSPEPRSISNVKLTNLSLSGAGDRAYGSAKIGESQRLIVGYLNTRGELKLDGRLQLPFREVNEVRVSADGQTVVAVGKADQKYGLWIKKGAEAKFTEIGTDNIKRVNISPDGSTVVVYETIVSKDNRESIQVGIIDMKNNPNEVKRLTHERLSNRSDLAWLSDLTINARTGELECITKNIDNGCLLIKFARDNSHIIVENIYAEDGVLDSSQRLKTSIGIIDATFNNDTYGVSPNNPNRSIGTLNLHIDGSTLKRQPTESTYPKQGELTAEKVAITPNNRELFLGVSNVYNNPKGLTIYAPYIEIINDENVALSRAPRTVVLATSEPWMMPTGDETVFIKGLDVIQGGGAIIYLEKYQYEKRGDTYDMVFKEGRVIHMDTDRTMKLTQVVISGDMGATSQVFLPTAPNKAQRH